MSPEPDSGNGPEPGTELELEIGPPGAGGVCVARHEGRVVFVRHALPGERVRAVVTEARSSYLRADALQVLDDASPDRVEPPCPHAGPGRCGGCDFQHVEAAAQRQIKAEVIEEQLRRLAGIEREVTVEPLPGGLLGWRTRVTYAVGPDGRPGLHRHRSDRLEPVEHCPLGEPGVGDSAALARTWPGLTGIEVVAGDTGERTLIAHRPAPRHRNRRGPRPPDRLEILDGPAELTRLAAGQRLSVAATGFWQAHRHVLDVITGALLDGIAPVAGERVLELYSGAGALTVALAGAVGPRGRVVSIESDATAVADAQRNLGPGDDAHAAVSTYRGRAEPATVSGVLAEVGGRGDGPPFAPDLIVLDPPRSGAGAALTTALCALAPRAIGYVSCDPASLARDLAAAASAGWELTALRAFDAFPMTHHVECVAVLEPVRT